jgi:lactate dehydrogenase-like 2-hydroxyacid dehydrogenase
MRERMPVDRALLERLPNLKLIIATGTHNRTLDQEFARARGIAVAHTRGGESQYAIPELAWALILAVARSLPQEDWQL